MSPMSSCISRRPTSWRRVPRVAFSKDSTRWRVVSNGKEMSTTVPPRWWRTNAVRPMLPYSNDGARALPRRRRPRGERPASTGPLGCRRTLDADAGDDSSCGVLDSHRRCRRTARCRAGSDRRGWSTSHVSPGARCRTSFAATAANWWARCAIRVGRAQSRGCGGTSSPDDAVTTIRRFGRRSSSHWLTNTRSHVVARHRP